MDYLDKIDISDVFKLYSLKFTMDIIEPNLSDPQTGITNFMILVAQNQQDQVNQIIGDAHLNQQDHLGNTALIYAISENLFEMVDLLLKAGADPNLTNNDKNSPLDYAREQNNKEIVDLLMNAGAKGRGEVFNVMVKYIRPQYQDLQDWCQDPNNVYIGRAGVVFVTRNGEKYRYPKQSSKFANPFKIEGTRTREDVLVMYKYYIDGKIASDPSYKEDLIKMKGKNLGCWCAPNACHGDYLLELINNL